MEKYNKNAKFAIWGCGDYLENVINKIAPNLDIVCICDSDSCKIGKVIEYNNLQLTCISVRETLSNPQIDTIMVAVQSAKVYKMIEEEARNANKNVIHINDAVRAYMSMWERQEIEKYDRVMESRRTPLLEDRIVCFVNVSVPIDFCNLKCQYCYVGQHNDFYKKENFFFSPKFIKKELSRKRLHGTAFINFCGTGETLLCKELLPIMKALLDEGHYISIITNALVTDAIKEILKWGYGDRIFFKCSFHYLELKKHGLLEKYAQNVNYIKEKSSITVELVPHDELISLIPEIKDFSVANFGALPHVTVARNENSRDYEILTNLTIQKYFDTWNQFESELFRIKMVTLEKQEKICCAGRGTFIMNLCDGGMRYCPKNPSCGNAYDHIDKDIYPEEIGNKCKSPYCINAHAYLTLGMISEVNIGTYFSVRDRLCQDGSHWIKESMKRIMTQRISDNINNLYRGDE